MDTDKKTRGRCSRSDDLLTVTVQILKDEVVPARLVIRNFSSLQPLDLSIIRIM
ncbi:MAG: hypothetical protein LBK58_10760 [Prevotellaceae bacterium]|jgi:hypothetical protein|nr:hypothetical protein [Prevotellaceae bacterium]